MPPNQKGYDGDDDWLFGATTVDDTHVNHVDGGRTIERQQPAVGHTCVQQHTKTLLAMEA